MAQPYVSGPVAVYVQHATFDSTPLFLGHGEQAPQPEFTPNNVPFECDLSGKAPLDVIYSGESARISVTLVRYNMAVLRAVRTRARTITFPAAVPGLDMPGQIGTLLITELAFYTVYLVFGGGAKALMNIGANGIMGAGFRFFACILDPESHALGSVTPYKVSLTWQCYRIPDFTLGNALGFGAFGLYDQNVTAALAVPMN